MAEYRVPAVYVWSGTEWVLTLPYWYEAQWWYIQQQYFSSDGTNWRTV